MSKELEQETEMEMDAIEFEETRNFLKFLCERDYDHAIYFAVKFAQVQLKKRPHMATQTKQDNIR